MSRWRRQGAPCNSECKLCSIKIWKRVGTHTLYHGKKYYDLNDKVQSVVHIDFGALCTECFEKEKDRREKINIETHGACNDFSNNFFLNDAKQ